MSQPEELSAAPASNEESKITKQAEEDVLSDEEPEEDLKDPAFILDNLDIASLDCFDDDTHVLPARRAAASIAAQQICFYVACALRGFLYRMIPAAPVILIYGGGYMGQRVIDTLVEYKCKEMLHVYTRGDIRAKYWRTKGLKSSPSCERLLKGQTVDIVIILSGMSGFQNLTKVLMPHINRSTLILSASLGIERKRYFALLRTPSVFRTYLEPQSLMAQINDNRTLRTVLMEGQLLDEGQRLALMSKLGDLGEQREREAANQREQEEGVDRASGETKSGGGKAGEWGAGQMEDEFGLIPVPEGSLEGSSQEPSAVESSIMDSIMTFNLEKQGLLQGTVEGSLEHSADLIAKRTHDIRDLIYLWENYYAMLGVKHRVARSQALIALLGYDPENYGGSLEGTGGMPPSSMPPQGLSDGSVSVLTEGGGPQPPVAPVAAGGSDADPEASLLENLLAQVRVHSYETLVGACDALEGAISVHFRRQFSKYIRLVDIPQSADLGNTNITAKDKKHKSLKKSGKRHSVKKEKKSENPLELAMQLEAEDNEREGELDGDGEVRDDGANEKDALEREKALGHGVPIHTDKRIRKILDYDMKLGVTLKDVVGDSNLFDDMSIFSGSTMTKYPSYSLGQSADDASSIASVTNSLFDDPVEEDGPRMMDMDGPLLKGGTKVTFKEQSSLFDDDVASGAGGDGTHIILKTEAGLEQIERGRAEREKTEMELLQMLETQQRELIQKQREAERASI